MLLVTGGEREEGEGGLGVETGGEEVVGGGEEGAGSLSPSSALAAMAWE